MRTICLRPAEILNHPGDGPCLRGRLLPFGRLAAPVLRRRQYKARRAVRESGPIQDCHHLPERISFVMPSGLVGPVEYPPFFRSPALKDD